MALDYGLIRSEAAAFLRDEDGIYEREINSGLRYAIRILAEKGVLQTGQVKTLTLPAKKWNMPLEQFGLAEILQIDWAYGGGSSSIWFCLEKTPFQGAELSRLTPPVGRPYRWSLWGQEIVFDGTWGQDSLLRVKTERDFGGSDFPEIGNQHYDAVLHLTVAYVQLNYLNIDASTAKGQAEAAVQRLLESRDRQLSGGTIQPFIY